MAISSRMPQVFKLVSAEAAVIYPGRGRGLGFVGPGHATPVGERATWLSTARQDDLAGAVDGDDATAVPQTMMMGADLLYRLLMNLSILKHHLILGMSHKKCF